MNEQVRLIAEEAGIARIVMDNPPLNALGREMRRGLADALTRAEADPEVRAIVLMAAGRSFPAGQDGPGTGGLDDAPGLTELCNRIEGCAKPVIAMIQGAALGGGMALALAAHFRIAAEKSHFGLPEVGLGLVPGAGATQRLPHLAGPAVALEMMLIGKTVNAAEAARLGIVDRVVSGDLLSSARAYARELLASGAVARPTRARHEGLRDVAGYQAALRDYRARIADKPILAPGKIVDCVEAALLLPFEAGLAFEATALADCAGSDGAKALRHIYLAEKRLSRLPGPTATEPGAIAKVAVPGSGAMAAGWAVVCLDAGLDLVLEDAGLETRISAIYSEAILRGRLTEAQRSERLARVRVADAPGTQADLVIWCGASGDAAAIEQTMPPGAILALSLVPGQALASGGLARPEAVIGIQSHGPAHLTRLVEVLVSRATSPETRLRFARLLARAGRVSVISPGQGGGIGASVWGACQWAGDHLVMMGATGDAVDQALRAHGFSQTPLQAHEPPRTRAPTREFAATEIVQRCLAAMANTGALLVEAGLAQRPGDIDMVMILGYGYPRWRGGPMQEADATGLMTIHKTLSALCAEDAAFWAPSGLFDDLIKNGRKFDDLNRA